MTSASWCSGTGSCLVLSSSWSLSTMAITQLRHLATFAHSLSWKSQMHNQQSDQLRWLHLCLTHTVYLWDCEAVIFFAQSKLRKAKRKCLKGYSEITFKAFPSFQAFSFFSWAPAGNWCIETFSLWMCVLKGGGGIHILDIFFLKIWVEHVIMAGDN